MTDAITDPYPELHRLMNEYGEEADTVKSAQMHMQELKQAAAPLVAELGGKADVGRFTLHLIESTERSSYDTAAVDAVYAQLEAENHPCAALLYEARKTSQVSASLRITPKKEGSN